MARTQVPDIVYFMGSFFSTFFKTRLQPLQSRNEFKQRKVILPWGIYLPVTPWELHVDVSFWLFTCPLCVLGNCWLCYPHRTSLEHGRRFHSQLFNPNIFHPYSMPFQGLRVIQWLQEYLILSCNVVKILNGLKRTSYMTNSQVIKIPLLFFMNWWMGNF